MRISTEPIDVAVVGGGIAGLTAAAFLAREGRTVTVFERSAAFGGRARTERRDGFLFNLGPHALYRHGAGARVLRELGVTVTGGIPQASGGYAIDGGRIHTLPVGFVSLATTGLLGLAGKIETGKLLASLGSVDPAPWQNHSVASWLRTVRDPVARRLVQALVRVSTYTNAADRQSAGAAIEQLQLALAGNVRYLDGGWQTIVDGLRGAARRGGAADVAASTVQAVEHDAEVRGVRLSDGSFVPSRAAVIAVGPHAAAAMMHPDAARRLFDRGLPDPVKMACLTIALSRLPRPRANVAFAIDAPLYLSVHSAVARLAPENAALVHVGRYLEPDASQDAAVHERELERMMDLIQPGWRETTVARQYLPAMTVSHALVRAVDGGTSGRPGPRVPGVTGLYVAGDWVGATGQLADASFASAREAAEMAARETAGSAAPSRREMAV